MSGWVCRTTIFPALVGAGLSLVSCGFTKDVITLDEYNSLTQGMSYEEAVSVIGEPGDPQSESSIQLPGVADAEQFHTESYVWKNADGSNGMVMFQGGKLITKAQAGL